MEPFAPVAHGAILFPSVLLPLRPRPRPVVALPPGQRRRAPQRPSADSARAPDAGPVWLRLMLCGFPYATVTVRVGANAFAPATPRPDRDKGGAFISLRLDIPALPAAAPLSVSLPIEVLSPPLFPPPRPTAPDHGPPPAALSNAGRGDRSTLPWTSGGGSRPRPSSSSGPCGAPSSPPQPPPAAARRPPHDARRTDARSPAALGGRRYRLRLRVASSAEDFERACLALRRRRRLQLAELPAALQPLGLLSVRCAVHPVHFET